MRNNWYPTQILDDPRYAEKSVALLSARAKRAFFEYSPLRSDPLDPERIYRALPLGPLVEVFVLDMRSYRGANSPNRQTAPGGDAAFLGDPQLRWLGERMAASKAVWKVVASDMPLGLVVPDGATDFEAVAQGDPGLAPRPRARDRVAPAHPQGPSRAQRRLRDGRRALRGRPPLRPGPGPLPRVPALLGVRGRAPARGHLRAQPSRSHLRARRCASSASRPA